VKTIRLGCGAGYSGDRIEPAIELAERGQLDYLIFECLAERTIALAQQARAANPDAGFDPLLLARMRAVLPACAKQGVRIITNMGAAHPVAAASAVRHLARSMGLADLKVAAVTGDDVLHLVRSGGYHVIETSRPVEELGTELVSANAYLGAEPLVAALADGADVIIAGRVADASMFVAPAMHEFGWIADAWTLLGCGTAAGHLLECAGQVTGGYFAESGDRSPQDLARLGFPIAELTEDGGIVVTKVPGSGGEVTVQTCSEQLLYEIHDPAAYITPDVVADFTGVRMQAVGPDRVRVEGARGRARTSTMKVSIGYYDGFIGEGHISYIGTAAVPRAQLAGAIVEERLRLNGVEVDDLRIDLIGVDALHKGRRPYGYGDPYEVRLRVAGRTKRMDHAVRIGAEVEALYTNGPAAGGGVTRSARQILAIGSILVPRSLVCGRVCAEEA
jgi:acyclic terpene utilization AtuA family protein